MDKAEKVFEKLALEFQGYVTPKGGPDKKKRKKLKERGYREVSSDEYAKAKGNVIRSAVKKKTDKAEGKAKGLRAILGAGGAGAGAWAGAAMAPSKYKVLAGLAGTAAGGLGGLGLGQLGVNRVKGKIKNYNEAVDSKLNAMADAYSVMGSDRKFYVKDNK